MEITRTTFGPPGLTKLLMRVTVQFAAPGPTTVIAAGVHGDEYTGVGTIHTLLDEFGGRLDAGTVHLYPALNPQGIHAGLRRVPDGDEDLNRLFPHGPNEGVPGLLAEAIWRDITTLDPGVLIDLHADSAHSLPYALLDRPVNLTGAARAALQAELDRLAAAGGLTVLREYPDDRYHRYNLHQSLSGAFVNAFRKPALTFEVGPCGFIESESVAIQRAAVLGTLQAIGHGGQPASPHPSRLPGGPWRREAGPRTHANGLLYHLCVPGQLLQKGTPMADLRNIAGRVVERVVSECQAYVISLRDRGAVSGETVTATLAVPDS